MVITLSEKRPRSYGSPILSTIEEISDDGQCSVAIERIRAPITRYPGGSRIHESSSRLRRSPKNGGEVVSLSDNGISEGTLDRVAILAVLRSRVPLLQL